MQMGEADIAALRAVGLDDAAIHDATQVVGFFNYINRVADGLGVEPENSFPPGAKASSAAQAISLPHLQAAIAGKNHAGLSHKITPLEALTCHLFSYATS